MANQFCWITFSLTCLSADHLRTVMARGSFSSRQGWSSANELVQAYSIGRSEAAAALNLLNSVAPDVCDELSSLVKHLVSACSEFNCSLQPFLWPIPHTCFLRQHSMQKFLTHESIAAGVFNTGTCCATSAQSEWGDVLTVNRVNLSWLIQRMSNDFASQHSKLRKPWSSKELVPSSTNTIWYYLVFLSPARWMYFGINRFYVII